MPGPVLAITITAVLQVGLIAPVLIILGHSILELALGKQIISDRVYMGLIIACGLFLLCLGVYFLYSGIKKFLQHSTPAINDQALAN